MNKINIKPLLTLNFLLALLILFTELFKHGVVENENYWLNEGFIIIHIVFAIVNIILAFISYERLDNFKFFRLLFLFLCMVYLAMCILWALGYHLTYLHIWTYVIVFGNFLALIAIGYQISQINYSKIHPAFLVVLSFVFLIILGTIALMLPHASKDSISFLDALFTATSAVTVTGLAVLDTGKDFTFFGELIILILIQLGGIGILTVTNLFSSIFRSEHSYKERILLSDMANERNTATAFKKLFRIVSITFIIEAIGAFLIYMAIPNDLDNPIFFSVFHAISAFCNAGFSTLSNSLADAEFVYNYNIQLICAWLLISGAIGYNVLIKHYTLLRNTIFSLINKLFNTNLSIEKTYKKTLLNTFFAWRTSLILLAFGFVAFLFLEWNNTLLAYDSTWGKLVVSFFNSATPRTAGFNNVNMAELGRGTIMLIIFLMWIGASPGSTGGGIKTTTFAVAFLNMINQINGKKKIILKYRQVPTDNILLVNTTIMLSLITLGIGIFILTQLNPTIPFESLVFECVSAYSTVGLSLGITADLSTASKILLMFLMFFGRVSFFTLLIGLVGQFRKSKIKENVRYPKEDIFL